MNPAFNLPPGQRIEPIAIQTDRLFLKSVSPKLISSLFETKAPDEIKAFFQFDDEAFLNLKSMLEKGLETYRISVFYFLLVDKESGQIMGECGFHTWNETHARAELFYSLRTDDWKNKGYMGEALDAVLDFGFHELNLHRIQALVAPDNIPSMKLLHKFNFRKEGIAREDYLVNGIYEDSECHSLLKHEWRKMHITPTFNHHEKG